MGTSGANVGEDDTFQDVYRRFFDLYNSGQDPQTATRTVLGDFAGALADPDDSHETLFALALAQWETQALDADVLQSVTEIISSGKNLSNWTNRGASPSDLDKRRKALDRFLFQISTPRKAKKRPKKTRPEIVTRILLERESPDGLKRFSVTAVFVDGLFQNTSGTVMWSTGGGGIFHINRPDVQLSACWQGPQALEIRFADITRDDVRFGIGKDRQVQYCGDIVALAYIFD